MRQSRESLTSAYGNILGNYIASREGPEDRVDSQVPLGLNNVISLWLTLWSVISPEWSGCREFQMWEKSKITQCGYCLTMGKEGRWQQSGIKYQQGVTPTPKLHDELHFFSKQLEQTVYLMFQYFWLFSYEWTLSKPKKKHYLSKTFKIIFKRFLKS